MLHRHVLVRFGVAVALLVPAAACTEGQYTGDPGPSFLAGSAASGGKAGTYGSAGTSGAAGTTINTGHAGTGITGTTGHAGATGAAGTGGQTQACTVGATGTFTMAWTLEDGAGTATTCDGVAAKTVDIDVANLDTSAQTHLTVPCAAMKAETCALPEGAYSVAMKLRADGGTLLSEIAAPQLFVIDGQATPIASLPFRVGGPDAAMSRGIAVTWSIFDVDTGAILTCADPMAAKVRLTVGTKNFDLPCTDGKGRTTALAAGDYKVTLRLINAQMGDLSVTQTMTIHLGPGQLVFLGDVPFDVSLP
jgi:hypothetical protein